jgi:hypothetical protein
MECVVCGEPLGVADASCPACGALAAPPTDHGSTQVSGARRTDTAGGPPPGEVLAERYEVEERIGVDAICARYRALDQETEQRVVLAVVWPELVPSQRERDALVARLRGAVGTGGRFLPGLLDADREGTHVFVVEPFHHGASLRDVLDARGMRGETMSAVEVLPVAAQLAAALGGIAPPLHHGDVRAERVLVDRDGLRLTGPFLLPALPPSAVARALAADDLARRTCAPEVLRGISSSDAADRFGVAAIVLEALTGRTPDVPRGSALPAHGHPRVDEALRSLLAADPAARPPTLVALVEALAEAAGLPVPDLDPAPFRRTRRATSVRPPRLGAREPAPPSYVAEGTTDVMRSGAGAELPPAYRAGAAACDEGPTLAEPADTVDGRAPSGDGPTDVDSTQRQAALDPATVDAILADAPAARPPRAPADDLDPRLVRAALGVTLADDGEDEPVTTQRVPGTIPLPASGREDSSPAGGHRPEPGAASASPRPVPVAGARPTPGSPQRPAGGRPGSKRRGSEATERLTADDLAQMAVDAKAHRALRAGTASAAAGTVAAAGPPVRVPRYDVQRARAPLASLPAPPATLPRREAPTPTAATPQVPAHSSPRVASPARLTPVVPATSSTPVPSAPLPPSARRPSVPQSGSFPARASVASADGDTGLPAPPSAPAVARPRHAGRSVPAVAGRRPSHGPWIIGAAVLIALLIVAGGAFIVWKRQTDSARARERWLEQRYERLRELRHGGGLPSP